MLDRMVSPFDGIKHLYHVLLVLEHCIMEAALEIVAEGLVILMLNIKVFHAALSATL